MEVGTKAIWLFIGSISTERRSAERLKTSLTCALRRKKTFLPPTLASIPTSLHCISCWASPRPSQIVLCLLMNRASQPCHRLLSRKLGRQKCRSRDPVRSRSFGTSALALDRPVQLFVWVPPYIFGDWKDQELYLRKPLCQRYEEHYRAHRGLFVARRARDRILHRTAFCCLAHSVLCAEIYPRWRLPFFFCFFIKRYVNG